VLRILIVLLWVLLLSVPSESPGNNGESGTIRGNVTVTQQERDELMGRHRISDRYLSRSSHPADAGQAVQPERYRLSEKAVIYIETSKNNQRLLPVTSSTRVILDQRDMMFYPHVLAIQQGTTVVFPNNDDVYHNVFSYSKPRQFDLGRYPKGQFRTVTFDTPGVVRIYCDIHAHMNAVILVLDNPYFTSPDHSGNFSIPDVPAGHHTIHFWYGRNLVESRDIKIEAGSSTNINFIY